MSQDLKPLIKDALREAQEEGLMRPECCSGCDLAPHEHAKHHQMLREAFSLRSQVVNAVITTVIGGGLVWLGLAVWEKLVRQAVK
jgi:hypothetical protein